MTPTERFVEAMKGALHTWTQCHDEGYAAPNPIYGNHAQTSEHHLQHHLRKAVEAFAGAVGTADDRPMTDKEIQMFSASLLKRCGL